MEDRPKRGAERVGERVTSDHRRLDALFHQTRAAFGAPGVQRDAEAAFDRLREAVDGHLAQEDTLYYPPLGALCPRYKDALRALGGAHDDFRHRLAEIAGHIAGGALGSARAAFDAFAADFGEHEVDEERLLGQIERELPGTGR
jgi:hypothetical protein